MRGDSQSSDYPQQTKRIKFDKRREANWQVQKPQADKRGANGIEAIHGSACKGEAGAAIF